MAKQQISFGELHAEKLVVALVAGLFLWVIYAFVVSSPNKVELKGDHVGPGEIDQRVKATADSLMKRLRDAEVTNATADIPNYSEDQLKLSDNPLDWPESTLTALLRRSVSFAAPVPMVVGPRAPGQVILAKLIPPDKPQLATGRLNAFFPPRAVLVDEELSDQELDLMDIDGSQDRSWVTVAAHFDVFEQDKVFLKHNYQTNRLGILASNVFLQRQRRLPSGVWSDWEDVHTFVMKYLPPAPEMELIPERDGEWSIPAEQRNELRDWLDMLTEYEAELVRPQLPEAWFGREWRSPMLKLLAKLYPDDWVYTESKPSGGDKPKDVSLAKRSKQNLEKAQKLFAAGNLEEAEALVRKVIKNKKASKSIRDTAQALLDQVSEAIKVKMRKEIQRAEQEENEDGEVTLDEQVYLAHDLSGEPGATYRYRMKLQAYNRYAAIVNRLKSPEDALRVFIESEWSEPSEPVVMPALQHAFLTSARIKKGKKEAKFEVYNWVKGEWVKQPFTTKTGEQIGSKKRVTVGKEKETVDFGTGVVLFDINTGRTYVPLTQQRDGIIKVSEPEITSAVLCLDAQGNVFERVVSADKRSEERKQIEKEIDAAKKAKKRKKKAGKPSRPGGRGGGGGSGGGGGR